MTWLQDPEGILAPPKAGHIARRQLQKLASEDKALAEQVEREREKARAELQAKRDVCITSLVLGHAWLFSVI